jgi:membrane-associated protease RseP (regulator of RpoE activity)
MEYPITKRAETEGTASDKLVLLARLRRALADVMNIEDWAIRRRPDEVISFLGSVHGDTESAFDHIEEQFAKLGYTARLNERPDGKHEVHAIKGLVEKKGSRIWVNVVLFVATVLSVLYIGARTDLVYTGAFDGLAGSELDRAVLLMPLRNLQRGIPFAATLLAILVTHEASHYVVGRRYGSTSLPYFIPIPEGYLGTMGALIVQRTPMRNRKVVFDTGIAGPIGGLVVAIPLLAIGLALSDVGPIPPGTDAVMQEGNSLLYAGMKYLMFGRLLPDGTEDVWLHPVAFAAWAGLLVTMINLLPIGQLDGGHISYALLGRRARSVGMALIVVMVGWGSWLMSQGNDAGWLWLMWGALNALLNTRHPPPLDDATGLRGWRIAAGLATLAILVLLLIPAPFSIVELP